MTGAGVLRLLGVVGVAPSPLQKCSFNHKNYELCTGWYHKDCEMDELLDELGISGHAFAARIGVHPNTITNWRMSEAPKVVLLYLKLLVDLKRLGDLK